LPGWTWTATFAHTTPPSGDGAGTSGHPDIRHPETASPGTLEHQDLLGGRSSATARFGKDSGAVRRLLAMDHPRNGSSRRSSRNSRFPGNFRGPGPPTSLVGEPKGLSSVTSSRARQATPVPRVFRLDRRHRSLWSRNECNVFPLLITPPQRLAPYPGASCGASERGAPGNGNVFGP
jgi:hypothetical protein